MTNTKENNTDTLKQAYTLAINNVISKHFEVKQASQEAYTLAVKHGLQFNDWYLLADFINKMLENKITVGVHLFNILKATNKGLVYYPKEKKIKQGKNFIKEETLILSNIWDNAFTGRKEKQESIFNEDTFILRINNLIKKAIKQDLNKTKLKEALNNALTFVN